MGSLTIKGITYDTSSNNLSLTWSKYNGNAGLTGRGSSDGSNGVAAALNDRSVDDINATYPTYRVEDYISGAAYPVHICSGLGYGIGWYPLAVLPTAYVQINFDSGVGKKKYYWGVDGDTFPQAPQRTGYTHTHWKIDNELYNATVGVADWWISKRWLSGTIAATAVWKAKTYTISFNANGGSNPPASQTKTYDSSLVLTTGKPIRANYDFIGWSTSKARADANNIDYYAGGNFTINITDNITLYAAWKPSTSTISQASDVILSLTESAYSTIKWTPNVNTFKFKIKASIPASTGVAATIGPFPENDYIIPGNTNEYTYQLYFPSEWITKITKAKSTICTLTLYTYKQNEEQVGSTTYTIIVTTPNNINPTVTFNNSDIMTVNTSIFPGAFTILDTIKIPWAFSPWKMDVGNPNQSVSNLKEIWATANGENNLKATSGTSGWINTNKTLQNFGENIIELQAIDERNNQSNKISKSIYVYNYGTPKLTLRYIPGGALSLGGFSYYIPNSNDRSINLNTYTFKLSIYQGNNTTPITNYNNIDITSNIINAPQNPIGDQTGYNLWYDFTQANTKYDVSTVPNFDTTSYRFEVTLEDYTGAKSTASVNSAVPVMTFDAGGTGITAHKPTTFEQGIISLNSSTSYNALELWARDSSASTGGRLKFRSVPDSGLLNGYVENKDNKLQVTDGSNTRASLDLSNGYLDVSGLYLTPNNYMDTNRIEVYPPSLSGGSISSGNSGNATSYWRILKYSANYKEIISIMQLDVNFSSSYGSGYYANLVMMIPPTFFSDGSGNAHWQISANTHSGYGGGIYSGNVHTMNISTGEIGFFLANWVSGTINDLQIVLHGYKY